ncbi:MAG: hypothetical protein ACPG49_07715 [Chitinophagales bacterium]
MKDTKLYQILNSFSEDEWKQLRLYISSPFFNHRKQLIELLYWIHHVRFKLKKTYPNRTYLWKRLFGKKPFDEARFYRLCSELNKLTADFIGYQKYQQQPWMPAYYRLQAFNERNLNKHFKTDYTKVTAKLSKQTEKDSDFYYHQYLFNLAEEQYLRKTTPNKRNLQMFILPFDIQYFIVKLRYYCLLLNNRTVKNVEEEHSSIQLFINYLEAFDFNAYPLIRLYYRSLLMFINSLETSHFFTLKGLLKQLDTQINAIDRLELYNFAQNYCAKRINQGDNEFLKELYKLYQLLLQKKVLLHKGHLNHWYYKNITIVAIRLKEFSWAGQFISEYKHAISENFRENAFNYNNGALLFYRKRYKKAIAFLLKIDDKHVYYTLDTKTCLLKTYYELDETEALLLLTHSFAVFVRNQKQLAETFRLGYLNLIQFTARLTRIASWEKGKINTLKKQIETAAYVMDKNWLLKKMRDRFPKT